ncbi:hypothetical protein [Polyangium fumosum]|uniref:MYXO-CTERM sorting domain-containing protein n=1 Tax=Polyangium fumosum TaxID=889272 RepID=A0A4U1JL80_9BACT|nr:hypothetical protein [Polyangium fumosum]TKD12845.1 hypothetical protein E8A74_03610 [Polyangium fumosum]
MADFGKLVLSVLAFPALLLASSQALAITTPPECGKFDFNKNGLGCEIRVEGGCEADCTSLRFTAGCEGGCTASASTSCTNNCGESCIAECDPSKLDCIQGCHDECEQPFIADCQANYPQRDCVTDAKASCTSRCRTQCQVQPSNCIEHCDTCCTGACTANINMDCDLTCYAKLEGGCRVQCQEPTGALFCNDQYVFASDVKGCISALLEQGLQVDVSAQAQGECTITLGGADCAGSGEASGLGCSASPGQAESPFAMTGIALGLAAMGISASRRRNRKNG